MTPQFAFPEIDERVAIMGHTGSGKTIGGMFLLSEAPFHKQPYVIFDLKEEAMFRKIPKLRVLDNHSLQMPDEVGLWTVRVLPTRANYPTINGFLQKIWECGEIGIFVDEGHEMPDSDELRRIFITGRSRRNPVIACSQRPCMVPRHMITEADYHMTYNLHDKDDRDRVRSFTPDPKIVPVWDQSKKLPRFHWRWYDSKRDVSFVGKPVPHPDKILSRINSRLEPYKKFI
jgi:hypothetical protein